jgi:hypothetical protein
LFSCFLELSLHCSYYRLSSQNSTERCQTFLISYSQKKATFNPSLDEGKTEKSPRERRSLRCIKTCEANDSECQTIQLELTGQIGSEEHIAAEQAVFDVIDDDLMHLSIALECLTLPPARGSAQMDGSKLICHRRKEN